MVRLANAFVARWKDKDVQKESPESQTWWNEFFQIFGLDRRSLALFQRRATRASTGRLGSIDVFYPKVMIAEHKSFGKDGGKAELQAEDYLLGGDITQAEMPRYIISSDFAEIQITDLLALTDKPIRFPLAKLPRHVTRFAFLSGYKAPIWGASAHEAVSVKVATEMGTLYEALMGDLDPGATGHDSQQASIFMTRLLFLMYGDSADGLWEPKAFARFINERTAADGSDTGAQIGVLFQELDKPKANRSKNLDDRIAVFPYVNGGLFRERIAVPIFNKAMRDALLKAMNADWRDVSPAIFGSFFQGASSLAVRREQGEHYTSEANVLKVLRPLFLDRLEERLQDAWLSPAALLALHEDIGKMQFLDPACGCGNFLIIAYREMRDIELRLLEQLRVLTGQAGHQTLDGTWELKVTPEQFCGIEINWWPAKIAETALFLVDHQANQRMAQTLGSAPERLPITIAAKIVHDNALRLDWRKVAKPTDSTYVFGNPPFSGQKEKSKTQTEDMKIAWGKGYDGYLDYVTGWHAKTIDYLRGTSAKFAFVSTNSIAQGQPVAALFRPILNDGWRIAFAHRTFAWSSDSSNAAGVHCIIVGFDKGTGAPRLFDYETPKGAPVEQKASHINPYLIDGPDVYIEERSVPLSPALPKLLRGSQASDWGHLTVTDAEYQEVAEDPAAAKYLRLFLGGKEFINNIDRWCLWLEDAETADLKSSKVLKARLAEVKKQREDSPKPVTVALAATPGLFAERRQPSSDYLAVPNTFSEGRRYMTVGRLPASTIASVKLFTAPDEDGFMFAVLSSSMAIAWQKMVGGRIKSDPSFSNTIVWNNLPFPELKATTRARIIAAGKKVLDVRGSDAHKGKSLSDLYNPLNPPPELVKAHEALDREVDKVFGLSGAPTESQRQDRLFARYIEMSEQDQLIKTPVKAPRPAKAKSRTKSA